MNQMASKFILAKRFTFDPNNNSLVDGTNDNEVLRLGSNESRILLLLSERPNEIISRDQLHEFVWRDQGFQVDDSSLTQAISTLRKMLGDSTKQPQFVKTIPKRGYKFIASVEKTDSVEEPVVRFDTDTSPQIQAEEMVISSATITDEKPEQVPQQSGSKENLSVNVVTKLMLLAALLIPAFVYLSIDPIRSEMVIVDTINSVPLETTEGHPPLGEWKELIKRCVTAYQESHPGKRTPKEFIVTAGPINNIVLNTVHAEEHSSENRTIQLITTKQDIDQLCR